MKKSMILFFLAICFPFFVLSQKGFDIQIEISEFKKLKGKVRICLSNSEENFTKECFQSIEVKVDQPIMNIIFKNIPAGTYAISLFHDEDENGKLNTGKIFGIPTEKYGFSKNPKSRFGPPKFSKCSFEVNANISLNIKI